MKFILAAILSAFVILISGNPTRAVQKPFCTYEECLPRCEKAGGKYCSVYCSKEVAARRVAGKCK